MNLRRFLPGYRRDQEREMAEEFAALEEIAGRKELGNLTLAAENARSVWSFPRLESWLADVRYALRGLARQPGFAVVATLSLALGIGANTAIFSLADAVLWRQLPVREPERLVTFGANSRSYFTYSQFAAHGGQALEGLTAFSVSEFKLDGGSRKGQVALVAGNYFEMLGVDAALGRTLVAADDRRDISTPAAVISHAWWQSRYGGERSVLGRPIQVERARYTIVGVAPAEFFGLQVGEAPDVWVPLTTLPMISPGDNGLDQPNTNFLAMAGRLRPGIGMQQASDMLTPLKIEIDLQRLGDLRKDFEARVRAETRVRLEYAAEALSMVRYRFSKPLRVILAMVLIVLLLAAVNVMGLQFARADQRRRELAVRLAIGAGRWRVIRQLLVESLLVAGVGGALGLALYRPAATALAALMGLRLDLSAHPRLLLFVVALSLASAVIAGVAPALHVTRRDPQPGLQPGSVIGTPARRRFGRVAIAAQLALSLVLVAGACLFGFSLHRLKSFQGGVDRRGLYVVEVDPAVAGYKDAQSVALDMRLRNRLAALPGAISVSFSQNGIYSGRNYDTGFDVEGAPGERHGTYDYVGPAYFSTVGTRLVEGREFNDRDDRAATRVVMVNQEFVRREFGGVNPVGRNLHIYDRSGKVPHRIIGVVQNIRDEVRYRSSRFYLCQPQTEVHGFSTRFMVRLAGNGRAALAAIPAVIRQEDPALQVESIQSAENLIDETLSTDRLLALLGWGFAALALMLAAVGIYGLLAHEVGRRTGEIGIRIALGASSGRILRMVLREAVVLCAMGLAVGMAAALSLAQLVESLVFGLKSSDPRVEVAAAALLLAVAIAAAWLPARRAARMQPMIALRHE